jgi:Tfp pilus assembly protein PilF
MSEQQHSDLKKMSKTKSIWLSLLVSILPVVSWAQDDKGVRPIKAAGLNNTIGETYAVVIGISDYQDSTKRLNFAHKDALAFADYLRSKAGGMIPESHIQVLTDSQATLAGVALALDWLTRVCKEDDRAIIYFSGHGDVETKLYSDIGYLLCWDAPSRVYIGGGALDLRIFQNIITSLATHNKSKILVILDACRSGTLAGNFIGGAQATASNLAKQWVNEIKILSCQPDQDSHEDIIWGGGRGVFSYYLEEGLYGFADHNQDSWITLLELGRYLEDHVMEAVLPVKQVPLIIGDKLERLIKVDSASLQSRIRLQSGKLSMNQIKSKGTEEISFIALQDSSLKKLYVKFNDALIAKQFLEPADACADFYYNQIIQEVKLKDLHEIAMRKYAVALQDDVQQVLNKLLSVDVNEFTRSKASRILKYKNYPVYLARAAELIGQEHFFYTKLKARQYFFEGLLLFLENSGNKNSEEGNRIMQLYRQSLALEKDAAHTYFYMMYCQATKFVNADSCIYYATEATNRSPQWVLPYGYLSYFFVQKFRNSDLAKKYLDLAMQIDSQNVLVMNAQAAFYFYKKEYKNADAVYEQILQVEPDNQVVWLNRGIVQFALGLNNEAERFLRTAMGLDSLDYTPHYYLGAIYYRSSKADLAEWHFKEAIRLNPRYVKGMRELARLYRDQQKNEEAEKLFREIINFDTTHYVAYYELACLSVSKNQLKEALEFLELSLKNGFKDKSNLLNDEELKPLFKLDTFQELMKKYFK